MYWKNWKKNYLIIFIFLTILLFTIITVAAVDPPPNLINNINLCEDKICICTNQTDEESGLRYQEVDCKSKNIIETYFNNVQITDYIIKLDLDGNSIINIPNFSNPLQIGSDLNQLKILILSRNKIENIYTQNFKHLKQLQELDLSWNQIHFISENAFDQLKMLQKLDISHNNLKKINNMIFSYLPKLQQLDLSWNKQLNESSDLQTDFYQFYGVTPFLRTLKLNGCSISILHLNRGVKLQNLYISSNNMHKMPQLPRNIKFVDFSDNPIETLNETFATHLFQLNTLHMNDMPNLKSINEYAFFGLPVLKIIHLQNCKKLKSFDPHAFGETVVRNETDTVLEELNLRGSSLTTLSSSLKFAFENLKILNLDGSPLKCNCELKWLKEKISTNNLTIIGQCNEPKSLHMKEINKINETDFECEWPEHVKNIVNGLIITGILIVCITLISIVVLGLRKKRSQRRHIGSGSPYARITIEPTCENRF